MKAHRQPPGVAIVLGAGILAVVAILAWGMTLPDRAVELRNRGFAELENEQPAQAEQSFRELAKLTPDDPLPHANLAISLLRQQKTDEAMEIIAKAEAKTPDDPRLIAIRGEILSWSGKNEAGIEAFRDAARRAPNDLQAQYTLYRAATTTDGESAAPAAAEALDSLARLRPENLVVLLQIGKSARENADRERATGAYLRIRELIWQAPQGADRLLDDVLSSLEANDLDGTRVPSLRLENVLKVTAMFRESLRELQTGIQGIPLTAFRHEPPVTTFGTGHPQASGR
jgi:tetratricopeptide (TPR) repeat protein